MLDVIICEKPSQGRAVAEVFGAKQTRKGFIEGRGVAVTWCVGHLLELALPEDYDPKYKKWSIDHLPIIPETFQFKAKSSTRSQLKVIRDLLKKGEAGRIIIATDGDREGEAIGRNVLRHCKYKRRNVFRAWLSSTDPQALKEAFANLRPINETDGYDNAAIGRGEYDWLLGMNVSRALGCLQQRNQVGQKSSFKISFGRVQSATLGIAIRRELEIKGFKPTKHYGVKAVFNIRGESFEGNWEVPEDLLDDNGHLVSHNDAIAVVSFVRSANASVKEAVYESKSITAPLPFKLSDLIKEAARFNLTPDETTGAMQTLYDPPMSLVTYPRTDNGYLPTTMLDQVPEIFSHLREFGYQDEVEFCDQSVVGKCWNNKKLEGSSHHGIIPTRKSGKGIQLNEHQSIIYDLICRRFLQQFAPKAEEAKSKIVCTVGQLDFVSTGTTETFKGWRSLSAKEHKSKHTPLPVVEVGDALGMISVDSVEKITKPPKRFTLASLIEEMGNASRYCFDENLKKVLKEGDGVGTEATRPGIVSEIHKKKQIVVKKGFIEVPSQVIEFMHKHVPQDLTSVDMTATIELLLNAVEKDEMSLEQFRTAQTNFVTETINRLTKGK
ncbi:DNA topoisomerase [Vibrio owensii]|uniref:DNA topoisomerase n=1 Tax=Vibrio owensii TaxID=696485 RepID=UPI0018F1615F|nr:DNA topoisomerase [Vibrio owensii]